ncbi:MAG: iron transporter [Candidatus Nephrothrix sp. EaCA]|nr:MAG: iron transporter [Candidatus Nephrothrix sp. EaCA]
MNENPAKRNNSSANVRDFVIGMSDGLTVPFALAAGLTGAISDTSIIATAGLAEIAAGGIAMGLGGYLAGVAEVEHYNAHERRNLCKIQNNFEGEKENVKKILADYGLSPETQERFAQELSVDHRKQAEFTLRYEAGKEKPEANRAYWSALLIGGSYVIGGLIPLSPYFLCSSVRSGLFYSVIIAVLCLIAFGIVKSKLTGQAVFKGALRVTLVGMAAAAAAYFIAKMAG